MGIPGQANFRPVVGAPGYRVTRTGKVQSRHRRGKTDLAPAWVTLAQTIDKYGYANVNINYDRRPTRRTVHRLMLEAFVGPCPPGMECCHNNGNRADNRIENLRWDTPKANQADAIRHGTRPKGERHWNAKITEEKAIEALKRFASGDRLAWIAADLGVSPSTIEALARGRAWKHIRDRLGLTFPVPTRGRPRKVAI